MMKLLSVLIMLFWVTTSIAQNLSKNYIDGWIAYYGYKTPDAINAYIIDGITYLQADSSKADSVLLRWPKDKLLGIAFFRTEKLFPTTNVPGKLVVLITSKGNQKLKEKKKLLQLAIKRFKKPDFITSHISADSTDPVLFIHNKPIFHADCFKELYQLNARRVYAIHITEYPVPAEYYGQNAKNGMVQIWLNKK